MKYSKNKNETKLNDMEEFLPFIKQQPAYVEETYATLNSCRCIFLSEDFTKENAAIISALLYHYDNQSKEEPITIYINSDGGDGSSLVSIIDAINMIDAPVETICMGKAYSAAAFLLAAGQKGKRFVSKHSNILIHGLQVSYPLLYDDFTDSTTYYKFLDSFNNQILSILAKHTGQPLDKIKKDCEKDMYFNAKEAINYGLADFILA